MEKKKIHIWFSNSSKSPWQHGYFPKDKSQIFFSTSMLMQKNKNKNLMLLRHRIIIRFHVLLRWQWSSASPRPASYITHFTRPLLITHDHQIETGIPSHDTADSPSRALLVVTATTDEIVRLGENEKDKKRRQWKMKKRKITERWFCPGEWGNHVDSDYFSPSLVGERGGSGWGDEEGVKEWSG